MPCSKLVHGRANEATDCAFTHESGDTMTTDEYEKLRVVDRKRFTECPKCREILSLEELPRARASRSRCLRHYKPESPHDVSGCSTSKKYFRSWWLSHIPHLLPPN